MSNPIRRSAALATALDLAAIQELVGHPLPEEYQRFLQATNGGVPQRTGFRYALASGKLRKARVVTLAPASLRGWNEFGCPPLPDLWEQDGNELVEGTIAVGAAETDVNGGTLRLGMVGEAAGRVFFRPDDTARNVLYPVASRWGEFLEGLTVAQKPEPWDPFLEDGDVASFRDWLDRHRRKWDDGIGRIEIERKAVEENQAEILDFLVDAYEFEPLSIVGEALGAHRLDLARRFLPAASGDGGSLQAMLNRPGPWFWHDGRLVEALLDAGADPEDEAEDGQTPLHHAAQVGAADAVRLLLARGADPRLVNNEDLTPRHLAERSERREVAALLQAAEDDRARTDGTENEPVRPFDLAGVRFARSGRSITLDEIRAVEATLRLTLPPEYRWLLMQANGAILQPGLLPASVVPELYASDEDDEDDDKDQEEETEAGGDEGPDVRLDLFPLRLDDIPEGEPEYDDEAPSLNNAVQEMAGWYHDGSSIPRGFVPIGSLDGYGCDGSGFLLIGCRGAKRGLLFAFDHNSTPLHLTLPDLFARLAEAGRRPQSPAERLADAVEAGDIDAVKTALAQGAGKTWMTRDGRIPLRTACEKGFDAAVQLIGEAGDRDLAIEEALMAGRVAVARLLFETAHKVKRDTLETILFCPSTYTDLAFLSQVVDRGVRLEKYLQPRNNRSLLEVAAASGSVAGLRFLLDRGGKVLHVDHEQGTTLLHAAVSEPGHDPRPMIAFLLGQGVPLQAGNDRGHTALHAAITANNPDAARALIDAGAEMTHRALRSSPLRDDPRTKKQLARVEKELEKLTQELARDTSDLGMDEEDAPMLDPSDPDAQYILQVMELNKRVQQTTQQLLSPQAASGAMINPDLGPAAADLAQTCPYPHAAGMIETLNLYAASRRPT